MPSSRSSAACPGECRVTLSQFDDRYEEVFANRPIADVGPLELFPRGTTALLDSIGRLVTDEAVAWPPFPRTSARARSSSAS